MSSPSISKRAGGGCPLCGKPVSTAHRPFCGQGCRDRDLLNWLGDGYRLPGRPADDDDDQIGSDGLDSGSDRPL